MAVVVLLAMIVGLFLGPIQGIYCIFVSGKAAGEYPFQPDKQIVVPLTPDMSPVRFNATIVHESKRNAIHRKRSNFEGTLSFNDKQLWTENFGVTIDNKDNDRKSGVSIRVNSSATANVAVHSFEVAEAGDYEFVAHQKSHEVRIQKMTLKVRSNVRYVNVPSAIAGFVLLIGGLVVGLFLIFRSKSGNTVEESIMANT